LTGKGQDSFFFVAETPNPYMVEKFPSACNTLTFCANMVFSKQALKNIKEAIELHVHTLAEDGLPSASYHSQPLRDSAGTLRTIIRQAGLSLDRFVEILKK
jgi:hypothetical protein